MAESGVVVQEIPRPRSKAFGSAKVIKKTTGLYKSKRFHVQLLFPLSVIIASFVIGLLHVHDCPIQPYIPIYLIVQGAIGLVILIIHLLAIVYILYVTKFKYFFIGFVAFSTAFLIFFLVIWFIAGNVWVFSVAKRVQFIDQTNTTSYCHSTLYQGAFWLIIIEYIMSVYFCCSFTWIPQSAHSPTNGIIKVRKQIPKVKRMLKMDSSPPVSSRGDIVNTRL